MNAIGEIEFHIEGQVGAEKLRPELVDIDEIKAVLEQASALLFPTEKRSNRPLISYEITDGSVKHKFKTLLQSVIGFGAVLSQIESEGQIDFLHDRSAAAIETLQSLAKEKNYVVTVSANNKQLQIDRTTHFERSEQVWVDAEFYLYGELVDAGGKRRPNIHLDTKEYGTLRITVDKDYLRQREQNLLYKKFGVRASGRQNLRTSELDQSSLKFIELLDLEPTYSEKYIDSQVEKATTAWSQVDDPDTWLNEMRGDYGA